MIRIRFHEISDDRHTLEVVRADGSRELVECETRSYLQHDLLHYAVEAQAAIDYGFWGNVARGKTLAELNDRARTEGSSASSKMMVVEGIVGPISAALKGMPAEQLVSGLRSQGVQVGASLPPWLTVAFVDAVKDRVRQLLGRWKATRFGGAMDLEWPPGNPADRAR